MTQLYERMLRRSFSAFAQLVPASAVARIHCMTKQPGTAGVFADRDRLRYS
jgi:hypothetical protein